MLNVLLALKASVGKNAYSMPSNPCTHFRTVSLLYLAVYSLVTKLCKLLGPLNVYPQVHGSCRGYIMHSTYRLDTETKGSIYRI